MGRFFSTLFGWPNGICTGNLLASAIWGLPAFFHLHRKMDRQHREQLERNHPVKLLLDVEKDAKLVEQRFADIVPGLQQDAITLGRTLATKWLTGGLSSTDVAASLRQVAQEVEQQIITAK